MKSRIRSLGVADVGLTTPWTPPGTTFAETALAWSVISVTWAVPPVTAETSADQAVAADDRVVDLDAVVAADVDRDVEYQTVGERAITRPVDGLVAGRDRAAAIEAEQLAQLRVLGQRRLAPTASCARPRNSSWRRSFSPRASKVSSNQLTRSRAGLRARSATSWTGLKTALTPRCTPFGPLP